MTCNLVISSIDADADPCSRRVFPTSTVAITRNNPHRAASGGGGGVEASVHLRGEEVSVRQGRCPDVIQQFRYLRDDVRHHSAVGDDT